MANIINHLLTFLDPQVGGVIGGVRGAVITPKNHASCVSGHPLLIQPGLYGFVLRKLALHLHFLLPFTLISNLNKSPAVFVFGEYAGGVWGPRTLVLRTTPHGCGMCYGYCHPFPLGLTGRPCVCL